MATGFFWDERCFWHGGGNYAMMLPVGGLVQPLEGGLPENPETKRRLKNLIDVTGLSRDLELRHAPAASRQDLLGVHPASYLDKFKSLSDAQGGEIGLRTPFGPGGYEIAACSAGLVTTALSSVLSGDLSNAYALSRPPGHHCLPDFPNGFCLLANIAIAIKAARANGQCGRVAVLDWDVHHGNGTEAIFYDDPNVLTISIHQERNYPLDTGDADATGEGPGTGHNMNIPLPPGAGHATYIEVMQRLVTPAISRFKPDVIVVACGFDAVALDPLGRMLASAATFAEMTAMTMALADDLCGGRLMLAHEGGYSEICVPFCGHAVLEKLSSSDVHAADPMADTFAKRQPSASFQNYLSGVIGELEAHFFKG
jgi:acetoin utilization deacetylase AcuC-like enzyme